MHINGDLSLGATGGGVMGNGEKTDGRRFDLITYVHVDDQNEQKTNSDPSRSVFADFIQNLDGTIHALCCNMDELKDRMVNRGDIMASCYEPDAFYISHVDNPNENGRILTALLYLNPCWEDGHGGELRLHRCGCKTHDEVLQCDKHEEECVLIEPVLNRLLLFWSDKRNLHEVLPTTMNRYAVSCWYQDVKETLKANSLGKVAS